MVRGSELFETLFERGAEVTENKNEPLSFLDQRLLIEEIDLTRRRRP